MRNIKTQVVFVVSIVIVAVLIAATVIFYNQQKSIISHHEGLEAENLASFVCTILEDKAQQATMGAYMISKTTQYTELFAHKKRDELCSSLEEMWKGLKERFKVAQFQFHLPPAVSFLRLHKPEKFGDDLSSFRKTVLEANEQKEIKEGVEKGKAGFGIRGVVPVSYEGKHVGTVEFGLSMDKSLLEFFKKELGGEWFLYTLMKGISWKEKDYFGTLDNDVYLQNEGAVEKIRNGEVAFYYDKANEKFITLIPVKDFSGNVVAYVKTVRNTEYFNALRTILRNLLLSLVIFLSVTLILLYIYLRRIFQPVGKITETATQISEGDLTIKVATKGNNEFSLIAKALNNIVDSVRETIKDTKRFMDGVVKIGDDIGRSAKQANEKMQSTKGSVLTAKGSVDSAVSAIEEVNAGVEEIASASQETAKNAQQADEQMSRMNELQQKGKEDLQEAVEKITNIKSMTDRTVKAVNKLQASSQEIGAIVDTINSIAEQTNLLALNAAIEAARAGEAGKGFAVVAEEIRNLAEETKKATANIGKLIEGIQNDTSDAVKVMNDTTKAVDKGTEVMDEVTKGLVGILEAVSKTSGMIQNIASMAEEQSASTEEIASAIDNVAKSANEITSNMDVIEKAAGDQAEATEGFVRESEELTRALKELEKSLSRFKV